MPLDLSAGNDLATGGTPSTANTKKSKFVSLALTVGSRSEQGKRAKNEDAFHIDLDGRTFVVADGMGGQENGERASALAVELIPPLLHTAIDSTNDIKKAIQETLRAVNSAIVEESAHQPQSKRMGTTVVLAVEHRGRLYYTGVGDSRIYLIRRKKIQQLTVDHTLADALYRNGEITLKEAEASPWQHVLYKFLGCTEMRDKPDVQSLLPEPGDRLLMATDGVTNYLNEKELIERAETEIDLDNWASSLIKSALRRGSRDNLTCALLAYDPR